MGLPRDHTLSTQWGTPARDPLPSPDSLLLPLERPAVWRVARKKIPDNTCRPPAAAQEAAEAKQANAFTAVQFFEAKKANKDTRFKRHSIDFFFHPLKPDRKRKTT